MKDSRSKQMKNKRLRNTLLIIPLVLLFGFMSYFLYHATINLFHQVINGMQRVAEMVPLLFVAILSVFVFIGYTFITVFPEDSHKKAKQAFEFGIIIVGLAFAVLVYSIVLAATKFGTLVEGVITDYYPIDTLVYSAVSLAIGVVFLIESHMYRNKSLIVYENRRLSKTAKTGLGLFSLPAGYFTGALMMGVVTTGSFTWKNYGFPTSFTLLLFALPSIGLLLYWIARSKQNAGCQRKLSWIFAGAYTGVSLALSISLLIFMITNPTFYSNEMHYMFPVGYTISLAAGLYILFGMTILSGSLALINLTVKHFRKGK